MPRLLHTTVSIGFSENPNLQFKTLFPFTDQRKVIVSRKTLLKLSLACFSQHGNKSFKKVIILNNTFINKFESVLAPFNILLLLVKQRNQVRDTYLHL